MRKLFLLFSLLTAVPAFASASKPQCIDNVIEAQTPYGTGTMRELLLKVYDASLWTDADQWSMNAPFALAVTYDMEIDGDDIADRSIEEMQHVATIPQAKAASYRQQLLKLFPDVVPGDTITALYDPNKGIVFCFNGKPGGSIRDMEFAREFMAIWFSPQTSEPKLRKALLASNFPSP